MQYLSPLWLVAIVARLRLEADIVLAHATYVTAAD